MTSYLIPLDGSKVGEAALPWAKFLADGVGSKLKLLRCYHPLASVYSYPDFATPPPVPYDLSGFLRGSEKYLHHVAEEHGLENFEAEVQEGDAAAIILEKSESDEVELTLMSSHGRGGLGRWLLGSVTTKVVRSGHKPVLVVRPESGAPKLDKILVCLDGSTTAEAGLKPAVKFAKKFGARLRLFRGVDYTPYPVADIQAALTREVTQSRQYLDAVAERFPKLDVSTEVQTTRAVDGILKAGKDCDLIVMSSHGHGGFERWILGSVAEKVLHRTDRPVLIVFSKETN